MQAGEEAAQASSGIGRQRQPQSGVAIKVGVTVAACALLIYKLLVADADVDGVAVGLLGVAILPWVIDVVERAEFGGWKIEFGRLQQRQDTQAREIETLKFLMENFLTSDEHHHLRKLSGKQVFPFFKDANTPFFETELRRLIALNLIRRKPGKGMRTLKNEGGDVNDHFEITEQGVRYLALLDALQATEVD